MSLYVYLYVMTNNNNFFSDEILWLSLWYCPLWMLQIEFGGPDVWPAPVDKKFCVPKQCKWSSNLCYDDWIVNVILDDCVCINGHRINKWLNVRLQMLRNLQEHMYHCQKCHQHLQYTVGIMSWYFTEKYMHLIWHRKSQSVLWATTQSSDTGSKRSKVLSFWLFNNIESNLLMLWTFMAVSEHSFMRVSHCLHFNMFASWWWFKEGRCEYEEKFTKTSFLSQVRWIWRLL